MLFLPRKSLFEETRSLSKMEYKVSDTALPCYHHLVERKLGRNPQERAEGERVKKVKGEVQGNLSPRTKVIPKGPSLVTRGFRIASCDLYSRI